MEYNIAKMNSTLTIKICALVGLTFGSFHILYILIKQIFLSIQT